MHPILCDAIVLRTVDLGEADRFCILLTRERGRLAARARAVRKLQSRMGGSLLPLRRVRVHLKEWSSGWLITSAVPTGEDVRIVTLPGFSVAQQGMELVLGLLEDDHPLPEVFDLTVELLSSAVSPHPSLILAYTVRLLNVLGLLPESTNDDLFRALPEEDRAFVEACRSEVPLSSLCLARPSRLEQAVKMLLSDQLRSPLKSVAVAAAMRQ